MAHESFEDADVAAVDERAVRQREGRPRGAARRRRDLHGGGPGHDRPGRLADDRVPHPRRPPVLRRHLLPQAGPGRHAGVPRAAAAHRRRCGAPGATTSPSRPPSSPSAIGRTAQLDRRRRPARAPTCSTARCDELVAAVRPRRWGGFGRAPKFPQAMSLDLLLRALRAAPARPTPLGDGRPPSLDAMAAGGIYDHLGGGFARYSVDERWLVPHFEKMLYDQALLAPRLPARLAGHRRATATARCVDETIDYVLRDLRHPDGGFFSAEDADSRGRGGPVLRLDARRDRRRAGGDEDLAAEAMAWYGVTAGRQLRGPHHPQPPGRGGRPGPPGPRSSDARRRAVRRPRSAASARGSTTRCSPSGTR